MENVFEQLAQIMNRHLTNDPTDSCEADAGTLKF